MSEPNDPFVLGVETSALARRWTRRLGEDGERMAAALAQRHGLPDVAARVLAGRGVDLERADDELNPTLRALLTDPSELTDCDRLVSLLADAVERGDAITLFADYDVDGATSAAVVHRTLAALGIRAQIVVPDRVTEGYGPSVEAMQRIAADGADVVIALDCGAGAVAPVEAAKAAGLTVLVIDHHPVDVVAPADAVVDPNRADDLSSYGACAAVGVAFVVMVALLREMRRRGAFGVRAAPDLMTLLDCVALGTVADVVPLTALNRAFVKRGLAVMARRTNPGLAALAIAARIDGPIAADHLGFMLGPRINAGGRIGNASLGARLLTTDDAAEAETIAATLDRLNSERRAVEQAALAEAEALVDPADTVIVVAGEWHPGVVGLVAARLKERHQRPAFAIALAGEEGVGSGRSIEGVDLGAAVRAAVGAGLLSKGGGHAMAAGLTVARQSIAALKDYLCRTLEDPVCAARAAASLRIDAVAAPGAIDEPLARALAEFGPYGSGRPTPTIALNAVLVERVVPVGKDSLRVTLRGLSGPRLEAMLFRASGPLGERLRGARGQILHVALEVRHGTFRGMARAEAIIVDVADVSVAMTRAA